MDWKSCLRSSFAKEVGTDKNLIASLMKSAKKKIEAEKKLPASLSEPKISLAYDALRSILEAIALANGFKIYNHECYASFLKEILGESELGDRFDKLRRLRNAINYYGKEVSEKEAMGVIKDIYGLILALRGKDGHSQASV